MTESTRAQLLCAMLVLLLFAAAVALILTRSSVHSPPTDEHADHAPLGKVIDEHAAAWGAEMLSCRRTRATLGVCIFRDVQGTGGLFSATCYAAPDFAPGCELAEVAP